MRFAPSLLCFAAAFFISPCFAAEIPPASEAMKAFEARVSEIAATPDMVGLAVAVAEGGTVTFLKTYGLRQLDDKQPVDPNTVFRIGSLSKGFASTLVAQLVIDGKVKLEDTVAHHAPAFGLRDRGQMGAVTFETVLSHRLGLPPYAFNNLIEAGIDPDRILGKLRTVKLICRVGQCYGYQNAAFNILTPAVEAAEGRPFERVMEQRIFRPLNMTGASLGSSGLARSGNWARSHRRKKKEHPWRVEGIKENYYRYPAAAGVNANIRDMAIWLVAQMGHKPDVLPPKTLTLLHKPRVATPSEVRRARKRLRLSGAHYGLGWRIYDFRGVRIVNHSGSVQGYSAQIAFLPDRNIGIVLMTNSRSKPFFEILPQFLNLVIDGTLKEKPAPS